MQKIKVSDLKDHPENSYYFDDMGGQKWEEFKESVRTSGVIEPVVVTQDLIIVSGHQRIRACRELEIDEVLCDVRHYADKDGRTKEDWITKDLIETNVRQRGDVGGSELKAIHRVDALRRIYGVINGGDRKSDAAKIRIVNYDSDNEDPKTLSEVAEAAGVSKDFYNNYKKLTNLIPEIQDMLGQGNVTASVASKVLARLSPDEQYQLFEALPAAEKLTAKTAEQYVAIIQDKQNEYTTEAAQMAVKLEKQVKKNADQEDLIAALKRQGDPDLIAQIDKLKDEVRTTYERGQAYREEAAQARRRAEQAEDQARKDRMKVDKASDDMNELFDKISELEDKLNSQKDLTPEGESLPEGYEEDMRELAKLRNRVSELEVIQKERGKTPIELVPPTRYTMSTVLQCLVSVDGQMTALLDKENEFYFDAIENLDGTCQIIGEIVTKLYSLKNKVAKAKEVA